MNDSSIYLHLLIGPLMFLISLIFVYFPPKEINSLYGHRTTISMKNQDTWNEANKRSAKLTLFVSAITCIFQLIGIIFKFNLDTIFLNATIVLVAGLIMGMLIVEKQLRSIFDKDGNRK